MSADRGSSYAVQFGENVRRHRDRADLRADRLGGGYFDLPDLDHAKD